MSESTLSRAAIVTGSVKRVGRLIAESLARAGYDIVLHYNRSSDEAPGAVAAIESLGRRAVAIRADLRKEADVIALVDQAFATFPTIDVLVTSAATYTRRRLEDTTEADLRLEFESNTMGPFHCCRHIGLRMVGQPSGGVITTIGDWAVTRPYRDFAAYFAGKGSVPTMTRMFANELGSRNPNVRVNCILPGPVLLPPDLSDDEIARIRNTTLVKRIGRPENIAQAVQFFIENDFVTGVCLPVDGGRSIFAPSDTTSDPT